MLKYVKCFSFFKIFFGARLKFLGNSQALATSAKKTSKLSTIVLLLIKIN